MDDLTKKCIPCSGYNLDISQIHKYQKVDGWNIIKNEKNIFFLEKKFIFKNFWKINILLTKLEKYLKRGHHPDPSFWWGYAKLMRLKFSENDTYWQK